MSIFSPRQFALTTGQKTYLPKRPCKNCGTFERHTKGAHCVVCSRARDWKLPPEKNLKLRKAAARRGAIERGERTYIWKNPCKRCGDYERFSGLRPYENGCVECDLRKRRRRIRKSQTPELRARANDRARRRAALARAARPLHRKTCAHCGNEFETRNKPGIFCSGECRRLLGVQKARQWRAAHPGYLKTYTREWKQKNHERWRQLKRDQKFLPGVPMSAVRKILASNPELLEADRVLHELEKRMQK